MDASRRSLHPGSVYAHIPMPSLQFAAPIPSVCFPSSFQLVDPQARGQKFINAICVVAVVVLVCPLMTKHWQWLRYAHAPAHTCVLSSYTYIHSYVGGMYCGHTYMVVWPCMSIAPCFGHVFAAWSREAHACQQGV